MPADHAELPVWNAENWFYEDFEIGHRIRSLRRTISEGESMAFNALVLDMHPYVADQMFAEREGIFGKRLVAGAFVFSAGLGLVATNCVNAFSYGYDKLRFIKPVFIGDTIYSIRTHLEKRPKYKEMGLIKASYQVFKGEGELVMYCEHLQTVKYRDAAAFADLCRGERMSEALLEGLIVLDMSQFLSGPFAALRLGDLGARVIKIERPDGGDLCRRLYLTDTEIGGDSTLFHAINRGKLGFAADFKNPADVAAVKGLVAKADVIIQNFRPGVVERLGLDYESAKAVNPRIVYASITGYGEEGPWAMLPGQDLLAQARSGLMWLNGDRDQGPVPFGLAIADLLAGGAIVQGVLAALVRRGRTGEGAHIETSLLEALVDFQFEVLTTYLNDGGRMPTRSAFRNAHAYLAAPYGVYATRDGFLAIAMTPLDKLAKALDLPSIAGLPAKAGFERRDEIKHLIADHVAGQPTAYWLGRMQPLDIWCAEVMNWPALLENEAFRRLDMLQTVMRPGGALRCERRRLPFASTASAACSAAAPRIGEHTDALKAEMGL